MRLIFYIVVIFFVSNSALADTIDFYHVYHNELKIAEFNAHNINDSASIVKLDLSEINSGDKITIMYFCDFIISGSNQSICIVDEQGATLIKSENKGRNHVFELDGITELSERVGKDVFCVRYYLTDYDRINFNHVLFYLTFEE